MWYQSIIYIVTALINGVKKRLHPQLNDLDNKLASAFHPQFKLSSLNDSEAIKVITERIVKLVNEKERLIDEKGQDNGIIFAASHIGSRLRKIYWGKTSERVPENDLGKVTANEGLISLFLLCHC